LAPVPRTSCCSYGFTLVELVIALALIGLISLLLFAGLRLGTRAWEGVEAAAERTAEPRIARNFLERALTQARPARLTYDAEQILVFAGDAQNLELVAPLSEHVGIPGLYVLRLSLQEERLVLTRWLLHPDVLEGFGDVPPWEPFADGGGPAAAGSLDQDRAAGAHGTTLLLDAVEELEITYFGVAEGEQDPGWHGEWLDQSRMPMAVRVHMTTREQTWPDMLIRLPALVQLPGAGGR
jgi:general secretion pathway protein J